MILVCRENQRSLASSHAPLFLPSPLCDSPGLDARGDSNIFRFNTCEDNLGAGIRIGGHKIDGHQYGQNNEIYENLLENNDYAGIKITVRAPLPAVQALIMSIPMPLL